MYTNFLDVLTSSLHLYKLAADIDCKIHVTFVSMTLFPSDVNILHGWPQASGRERRGHGSTAVNILPRQSL